MGNCLVTKLKASINDNNLPILGKVRVLVQEKVRFEVLTGKTVKVESLSGGTFSIIGAATASNVTEYTLPTGVSIVTADASNLLIAATGDGIKSIGDTTRGISYPITLYIDDIYNASHIQELAFYSQNTIFIGDGNSISKATELTTLVVANKAITSIKASHLPVSLTRLQLFNMNGVVNDFNRLTNLTELNFSYSDGIAGSIEDLELTKLTVLGFAGCYNIPGELKTWADYLVGKFIGKVNITFAGSGIPTVLNVTWNGQNLYAASGSYNPVITVDANSATIGAS